MRSNYQRCNVINNKQWQPFDLSIIYDRARPTKSVFYSFFYQQQKVRDCENEAKYICHLSHFEKGTNQPFIEEGNKKFITNVKYRF